MKHWPDVRDRPTFLRGMMDEFAGGRMSLEGDLSRCAFPADVLLSHDEDDLLRRNTIAPKQDFVVVRLTPDSAAAIFKQIMAAGLSRAIIHVQIERDGTLEVGAYDNFHAGCVVTGPGVSAEFLSELQAAKIIRGFREAVVVDDAEGP